MAQSHSGHLAENPYTLCIDGAVGPFHPAMSGLMEDARRL